jgi:hypothetical protein
VSALFDREHPPRHPHGGDDTAEIPIPANFTPHDPDHGSSPPAGQDGGQLRFATRARRIRAVLLLAVYAPASLGSAWVLGLAFMHLNLVVMLLMCGALVWLVPDTVRLARWLGWSDQADAAQQALLLSLHLPLKQRLVAGVLTALYLYLLIDWWLLR